MPGYSLDTLRPSGIHNVVSKERGSLPLNVNFNVHIWNGKVALALTFNAPASVNPSYTGAAGCDAGGCYLRGVTTLVANTFYHVAAVYDDATKTDPARWLAEHGWTVDPVRTNPELQREYGRTPSDVDLELDQIMHSQYISATR